MRASNHAGMCHGARRRSPLFRRVVVACVMLALLLPLPAVGIVSTSITIDSDLADWTAVRADSANSVHDTQLSDPDPDFPGQPDRDTYLVNATWDSDFLYVAFRRTSGGTKAITFGAYVDLDGDGKLQNSDIVCAWTVSQSASGRFADAHASSPTARILRYNQAIIGKDGPLLHPGGDPMGYDGETPDGWADVQSGQILPSRPMDGYLASNGIEFEGRVAWADLGVPAGSPISIHFANANGESFGTKWVPSDTRKYIGNPPQHLEENRGQVEDNVDGIWWLLTRGVSLEPDRAGGGDPGQILVYSHTLRNSSNTTDTFDLSAVSSAGWPVTITDAAGTPITSATLAPGASTTIRARVQIPNGTADGTRDATTITARSRNDASISDTVVDTTTSGRVTVTPDQSGTMAPGQTIEYRFTVANNIAGTPRTFDLSTLSSLGFPTSIRSASGSPMSAATLASGESTTVVVRVSVPATATVGSQDVTRLTASLQGSSNVRSAASATTRVQAGLAISPDNAGFTGANTQLSYRHTVVNSWPTTRTIALSATSSRGWPVTFYAADDATVITSVTVGPNGASTEVIARVAVPAGVNQGTTDVTTVRATVGGTTVTATDTTTVRRLATYTSSGYATYSNTFRLGDSVFGRATGLRAGDKVAFKWFDANGTLVRTSPLRTVDTAGMAFDDVASTFGQPTGGWRVELYDDRGRLLETSGFTMRWNARITQLTATDAPGVGSDVAVDSRVSNENTRTLSDTSITYTIWWDTDGNGSFGAGDTYIDDTGAPRVWNGTAEVSSHVTSGVTVAGGATWSEPAPWTVNNRLFPHQGDYSVTATWRDSSGNVIDVATTRFFSIPTLGWPVAFLMMLGTAVVLGRRMKGLSGGEPA